jgi:pyridinium-3,5-bisthiocarboxylic acid mononucleotide nickel chelatase
MAEKILYYDCFSGISGDMNLGAMVDLGVPADYLRAELGKLGLPGWALRFERDSRKGIGGTRADVLLDEEAAAEKKELRFGSPLEKAGTHADGHHDEGPTAEPGAKSVPGGRLASSEMRGHGHRSFSDIVSIIERSGLSDAVKEGSVAIFRRVAEAEGKVHGQPVETVEFHEVGALDSIIDIVGAAICLDWLKVDRVLASTVELGGGFVKCAHGLLPVPAPATVEILTGIPVKSGAVPFETTTPTGAAILAATVDAFTDDKRFTIGKVAYGIGHRDTDIPNALRLFLGEAESVAAVPTLESVVIECNIDDMNPEFYGYLSDRLFAEGASDVWFTPIVMKKSRPAVTLSVLCFPEREDAVSALILRETTTFGLRRMAVGKLALDREVETIETSLGTVRIKTGYLDGRRLKAKPEFEDCRNIAESTGLTLREVYETVLREYPGKDESL